MMLPLVCFAIFPTMIGLFLLIRTIETLKNFDRKRGALSDLNLTRETRKTLFTIMLFWETCQAMYLLLLRNRLALNSPILVFMIVIALVSSLVGLLFKSRTIMHDALFFLSGLLSLAIMMILSDQFIEIAVVAGIFLIGIYMVLLRYLLHMKNYWKIEIFILILYALWNVMAAF